MPEQISSLPVQVATVMASLVRSARLARRDGEDRFCLAPVLRPLPLPIAVLKAAWLALRVGVFRGRVVTRLLSARFSGIPERHPAPPLRRLTVLAFKGVYLLRKLGTPPRLLHPAHRRLYRSAERQVERCPPEAPRCVDTIDGTATGDDEVAAFIRRHIDARQPCIVRGLRRPSAAMARWSVDWFVDRYGDTPVPLTEPGRELAARPLRDVRDRGLYLQNCESIFATHTELLDQLEIARLERLAAPLRFVNPHLFLGPPGSGSPFHCAPLWNVFLQIEGRKRWTWVHPANMIFMYPQIVPLLYSPAVSHVMHGTGDDVRRCPLYARVPRYEATLEPGDIMLNPPWWWHSVSNVTPSSCAVATRWHQDGDAEAQLCAFVDPAIQTWFSWEAAAGMSIPLLTFIFGTGLGMVKPGAGRMTFSETVTRYNRPPSSRHLL